MSQEFKKRELNERDINRVANDDGGRRNYEGFEGMNFEQLRQPFNPEHISRNRTNDDRKDGKRPDEG